ncbi:hypothetical protein [Hydrotalea sp.]|uniref:hypothetical protein n=1 Tax=Hydrotalea sp. TaxID=2881279 RepID=UPI0026238BB4|nr:hypothetical protein [Hydrotalea sp.]
MKKIYLSLAFCTMGLGISLSALAQQRQIPPTYSNSPYSNSTNSPAATGFQKQNMFIGGGLSLGFGTYSFNIGGTPEIGYSFNEWLDAGVSINLNYQSVKADPYFNNDIRQRSFNYGGGPFVRIFPIKQLFLQGQFEQNWIKYNYLNMTNNQATSFNTNASSFLAGVGYAQRIIGQSTFYTVIMVDVLNSPYSPYRSYNGVTSTALPIIRAGFNFYLHPKKQ